MLFARGEKDGRGNTPQGEVVGLEERDDRAGVLPEVAVRPSLGGAQTQGGHLREHALWTELRSPAGDFTHTPRDGASGDSSVRGGHSGVSLGLNPAVCQEWFR